MNTTAIHIAHLLPDHSLLSVAGLGVFSSIRRAASYDDVNHTLNPPSYILSFTSCEDCEASSALVASVSRAEGITDAEAQRRIEADVLNIRHQLEKCGSYEIARVGTLVSDSATGDVAFRQNDGFIDCEATGWLETLSLVPLAGAAGNVDTDTSSAPAGSGVFARALRLAASSAAAIIVFAVVAFITSYFARQDSADTPTMASVAAQPARSESLVGAMVDRPGNTQAALVLVLNTPVDGVEEVEPRQVAGETAVSGSSDDDPYCLVVASLANRNEAQRFIDAYGEGLSLGILEKDGRYRVYAVTGSDPAEVLGNAEAAGVNTRFTSSWVCRR